MFFLCFESGYYDLIVINIVDTLDMMKFKIIGLLVLIPVLLAAQQADSLKISVGTRLSGATQDFQPLWITSNAFGLISENKIDASSDLRISNSHFLDLFKDTANIITVSYAVNASVNDSFGKFFLGEGFAKVNFRSVQFQAGRFRERTGEINGELSSGSFGISGNALPIPKLKLSIPHYIDVPFLNGIVQFKGAISHGWMGNDRNMQNAYFHEKMLYGRFNINKVKIFGGFQHFAEWGGNRGSFKLDRTFGGFLDVLLVREANDGSLDVDFYPDKRPNRAGDQRGLFEYGIEFKNGKYQLTLYNQTPFESGKGLDIRNIDRLLGLTLVTKDKKNFLQAVVLEFIYTKQMESFGSSERQSYYNNGVYANGWEYQDRIIGTPLFINRVRGSKFLPVEPFDWEALKEQPGNKNIINNRIIGGHIGFKYGLSSQVKAKTLLSYTVNYGTHSSDIIKSSKSQFYSLQQFEYDLSEQISLSASVGFDFGEFYNDLGSLIGIRYFLTKN